MLNELFDLSNPIESTLYKAFRVYAEANLNESQLRERLAMDFPMLENDILMIAEEAIYKISDRDISKKDSDIEWIRIYPLEDRFEPLNSKQRTQFIRKDCDKLLIDIRIANLNFGENLCSETYVFGYRYGDETATPIKEFEALIYKDTIAETFSEEVDLNKICPESKAYAQSLEFIVWKKDDPGYVPHTLEIKLINNSAKLPVVTKWELSANSDGYETEKFDIYSENQIYNLMWIENWNSADFRKELSQIECEVIISNENAERDFFSFMIYLDHAGSKLFKTFAPALCMKFDDNFFYDKVKGGPIPMYLLTEGKYVISIYIWGKQCCKKNITVIKEAFLSDDFDKLLEEYIKKQTEDSQTQDPEPEKPKVDPFDQLQLKRFAMYHVPEAKEHDVIRLTDVDDSKLFTAFPQKEAKCISIHAHYLILKEHGAEVFLNSIRCKLYDKTGRLLSDRPAETSVVEDLLLVYAGVGKFTNYKWEKGRYNVEFTYEEQCIGAASFEIGERFQDGEYDVHHILRALSRKNKPAGGEDAYSKLMSMTGLDSIKEKVNKMRNLVEFAKKRKAAGLPTKMPTLHTYFLGNPGTGKTTVANLIGMIYRDLGLLSIGHVITEERKTLLGRFWDSESKSVSSAVNRARGGILLIDEAYNLYVKDDDRDPGRRILENLLTELSDEDNRDWMLILAGYTDRTLDMVNSNQGLKSRLSDPFYFDDYTEDQLMEIAELYCTNNKFILTNESRIHLRAVIRRELSVKDEKFGNGRFVNALMDQIVTENMADRLSPISSPSSEQLQTILPEDIPSLRKTEESHGMSSLDEMVGLSNLKRSIESHMNFVKLTNMRIQAGLGGEMPPLHMIFTGNPGTGKTTVAAFMGEIYASMGILSQGNVVNVERSDLVGSHIGETELKVRSILNRAKGNILFIDEAYQLYHGDDNKDFGKIAMETLLTTLSKEHIDMIVILAGYPEEMKELMTMNSGIKSRFPYTFHFEDYSIEELVSIAVQTVRKQNYEFTPEALERLTALTKSEMAKNDSGFGNARFIKRLISTKILTAMADRIARLKRSPRKSELTTIIAEDIPLSYEDLERLQNGGFSEREIENALAELDAMVGMEKVKNALHNFVDIARYRNTCGEKLCGKGVLKWSFAGNTGTGKSSVAGILAKLLKAMGMINSSDVVEVKGEEIFNVSEYQCNEVLTKAMQKARYGMLFIDGDAPEFRNGGYYLTTEQLKIKISSLTAQNGGVGAIVIAENTSPNQTIATSLAKNGIYDFDHTLIFDDYTPEELFSILCSCLKHHDITFTYEAETIIRKFISDLRSNRDNTFANARTMKHLARTIRDAVLLRMSRDADKSVRIVKPEDVESFVWNRSVGRVGY